MIITLKGADFSSNKIGTLSTWTIFTTLGSGATYSGNRTIDKGNSLSATITIADGYELGSTGVSVIMGTTDITSGAAIVNGNTITISIATVIGDVTIKVPTLNTSTGEESGGEVVNPETPSNEETNLTSQFNTWTPGTITASTGGTSTADTNWLFSNLVEVSTYSKIRFTHIQTSNPQTSLGYTFYDSSMNAVDYATNSGTSYAPVEKTIDVPSNAKYFRCMWINTTSANYNESTHNISNFYCYGIK